MKKYKYKIIERSLNVLDLNEFGQEGWELVNYNTETSSYFPNKTFQIYIFKREILETK